MSNPMEALPAKVLDALRKGKKIEAIKLLREVRSLGLAEAKNFVEWHLQRDPKLNRDPDEARTLPPAHAAAPHLPHPEYTPRPGLSPGEVPRGGGGAAAAFAILMAVVVSVAAYFLLN